MTTYCRWCWWGNWVELILSSCRWSLVAGWHTRRTETLKKRCRFLTVWTWTRTNPPRKTSWRSSDSKTSSRVASWPAGSASSHESGPRSKNLTRPPSPRSVDFMSSWSCASINHWCPRKQSRHLRSSIVRVILNYFLPRTYGILRRRAVEFWNSIQQTTNTSAMTGRSRFRWCSHIDRWTHGTATSVLRSVWMNEWMNELVR